MTIVRTMAVLVANGFDEAEFISLQKMMREMSVSMKIVSANQGLVNGWNGSGWGHNYAVDAQLNTALGVDYDGVVIMSGERSHQKLETTAHTKRFVNSIVEAGKPVIAIADAEDMMNRQGMMMGDNVMTGAWSDDFMAQMTDMLHNSDDMKQAA